MSISVRILIFLGACRLVAMPLGQAALAQTPLANQMTEDDLKQVLLRYQGLSELSVDFEQVKTLKEMKRPLRSKGHLTVRPPDSVTYKITSPAALTVILTAQSITIESGSGTEKTKQVLNAASLKGSTEHRHLQEMVSWLQMNPHDLAANYKITRQGERTLHFVPLKPEGSPFTSLDMAVTKVGDVTNLIMNEASGDTIEFVFSSPKITLKK